MQTRIVRVIWEYSFGPRVCGTSSMILLGNADDGAPALDEALLYFNYRQPFNNILWNVVGALGQIRYSMKDSTEHVFPQDGGALYNRAVPWNDQRPLPASCGLRVAFKTGRWRTRPEGCFVLPCVKADRITFEGEAPAYFKADDQWLTALASELITPTLAGQWTFTPAVYSRATGEYDLISEAQYRLYFSLLRHRRVADPKGIMSPAD